MKRKNGYKGAGVIVFCKSDDVLSKALAINTIKQDYYLLLGKRKYNCLKFRIKDIFYWFTKSGRKHLRHSAKPQWSVPGGGMENIDNGSYFRCAIREFWEETDYKLPSDEKCFIGHKSIRLPFFKWKAYFIELPFKDANEIIAKRKYFSEFSELQLVKIDDAIKAYNLSFGMKSEIKFLDRKIEKSVDKKKKRIVFLMKKHSALLEYLKDK